MFMVPCIAVLYYERDALQNSLFIILQVHSTCFGCQPHPSSGVHKTVTTASGTGHIFCAATSLQRKFKSGSGSSVAIATDYGLDGPGSNPGEDEIFRPSRPALGPTQAPVKWVPGVKCGRGVQLIAHPLLVPRSLKSRATPLPTLWATSGL